MVYGDRFTEDDFAEMEAEFEARHARRHGHPLGEWPDESATWPWPAPGPDAEARERAAAIAAVADVLEDEFGPARNWAWTWARRPDFAECILDAVFAIQSRHADVERLLLRWRAWRRESGTPVTGAAGLARVLADGRSPAIRDDGTGMERAVLPRNRVAKRLKVEVVAEVAAAYDAFGVDSTGDFHALMERNRNTASLVWLAVRGLGETSWCHLRLLTGSDVVQPGPRVRRFLGDGAAIPAEEAASLVHSAARLLDVPPVAVEYGLSLLACKTKPKAVAEPPAEPPASLAPGERAADADELPDVA